MTEYKKERDELLLFHSQIKNACVMHMAQTIAAKDSEDDLKITNFTFQFNVHTMASFYIQFINDHFEDKLEVDNIEALAKEWDEHFNTNLKPMYVQELKILKDSLQQKSNNDGKLYS